MKRKGLAAMTAATALLGASASAADTVAVPQSLWPQAGQTLQLSAHATGVQIYECRPGKDPARLEWVFKAPEADLFDAAGKRIGKHYAGPTWESIDGSKVVAEVKARDDGPDLSAIPWLLLSAKTASGNGVFSGTASIQRVQTVGGKPPAGGCTQAQAGQELRVPYSATYNFYTAAPGGR